MAGDGHSTTYSSNVYGGPSNMKMFTQKPTAMDTRYIEGWMPISATLIANGSILH